MPPQNPQIPASAASPLIPPLQQLQIVDQTGRPTAPFLSFLQRLWSHSNNAGSNSPRAARLTVASTVLTAAQILASFSSPPMLLPAPGTNSYYWVFGTSYALLYGGTPYLEPALNGVLYGGASGQPADGGDNSILTATASQVYTGASFSGSFFAASGFLNQPLIYGNGSANPTGGNGSLSVAVAYAVVSAP
jgi:hypothetical protein